MSWWVYLEDEDERTLTVPRHYGGATYPAGGSTEAATCITYNYSKFYYDLIDSELGIRWLAGKEAGDTVEILTSAIDALAEQCLEWPEPLDYWDDSPWNARKPLYLLRNWANLHPNGIWRVS